MPKMYYNRYKTYTCEFNMKTDGFFTAEYYFFPASQDYLREEDIWIVRCIKGQTIAISFSVTNILIFKYPINVPMAILFTNIL